MAMATSGTKPNNQFWYTINAKSTDTAEISIYDEIGGWGVSAQQFSKDFKALGNNLKQINLHIHSPGGDVFDGIAIYNLLKNLPTRPSPLTVLLLLWHRLSQWRATKSLCLKMQ